MRLRNLLLGCIADDFTGAGDIASFLTEGGVNTILCNGIPDPSELPDDAEAVVIALKSRTAPMEEAVRDSLRGIQVLEAIGSRRFYIKYCSTFDSAPRGNIGPVLDAVLEYLHEKYTLLCPSLPVNGRTVKEGILYVNGLPLEKSPMKDHPLTPMWDSEIANLMKDQSQYPCFVLSADVYQEPKDQILRELTAWAEGNEHYYIIPDYYSEDHPAQIIHIFDHLNVFSGGSGLAAALARHLKAAHNTAVGMPQKNRVKGPALIVAGSVSKATIRQIQAYKKTGAAFYKIHTKELWKRDATAESIWQEVEERIVKQQIPLLVYCSDGIEDVLQGEQYGREEFAKLLEDTLAVLAKSAVDHGVRRIIVAGGETSGAVTKKLGYPCFEVGSSAAPGIPVLIPCADRGIRLILKSGNFGRQDFFTEALDLI